MRLSRIPRSLKPLPIALFAFILFLAMSFGARAALGQPASEKSGVLRATLKNGMQVVIVKNTLAPVVTSMVTYRVGSNGAPPAFPGIALALEHRMCRGSPALSANQVAEIAAAIGGM